MKLYLNFKTPDIVERALEDIEDEDIRLQVEENLKRHIKWGEYVTLVYDTETDILKVDE